MINNEAQLNAILGMVVAEALDNTTQILLTELNRIIDEKVYGYNETWSGRTGQFKESWAKDVSQIVGNIVQNKIYQDYGVMKWDGEWSHGNPWSQLEPNGLNDIIENGLSESHFGFPAIEARPFWSTFENYADANLDRIWVTECKKLGLDIKPLSRV